MKIERTEIDGVLLITPAKHGDARGFFSETFRADALRAGGIDHDWVQDNHSLSGPRGVVRGLHFQRPPHAQAKLLRVVRGAVLDIAVDLRKGSSSYGRHVAVELSAENWRQIYVPAGFAHGFQTLHDQTEVHYRTSAYYAPEAEGGLLWNDPDLAIAWPIKDAILKDADRKWPAFSDFATPF